MVTQSYSDYDLDGNWDECQEYDENGQVTKDTYITYDKNGQSESTLVYEYDENGQVTSGTYTTYDANGEITGIGYDNDGDGYIDE